jgi:hypothetical protein
MVLSMPTQRRNDSPTNDDDDDALGALVLQGMWSSVVWDKRRGSH